MFRSKLFAQLQNFMFLQAYNLFLARFISGLFFASLFSVNYRYLQITAAPMFRFNHAAQHQQWLQ